MPGTRSKSSSLAGKLGVEPGQVFCAVNARPGINKWLGKLPKNVEFRRHIRGGVIIDVVLLFAEDKAELEHWLSSSLSRLRHNGSIWVAWPKRSSGRDSDLSRDIVRKTVKRQNLKPGAVRSINDTWSAHGFKRV